MADTTSAAAVPVPEAGVAPVAPAEVAPAADAAADVDRPKKAKKSKKDKKPKAEGELSAKELRKLKAQREAEELAKKKAAALGDKCGDAPLIQSTEISGRVWTRLSELNDSHVGKKVLIRARVHTSRSKGKAAFMVLRQGVRTVQGVLFQSKEVPKEMIKYADSISRESIVDVTATVSAAPEPIEACTIKGLELQLETLHTISRAMATIPFTVEEASRPQPGDGTFQDEDEEAAAAAAADEAAAAAAGGEGEERTYARVTQKTRLDNRWIDLRTPANLGIMRISSGVCTLFREFLLSRDFMEIQTPKLLGGASEGGSEVFHTKYFGQPACLAQSPQLYKQMTAACSDFERVFEIGPVFRAENSNSHRHLCEFHGLDMEMAINEHYYEVLDVFSDLFVYIFKGIQERFKDEIEAVRAQYPFEDFKFCDPALRLTYPEGVALLREAGVDMSEEDDLTTANEKLLGKIVKEKYGTDFFMMDKYPLSVRPFYTMPDPSNPKASNSYDFFMRGEEILSGAQRIHDPEMLVKQAQKHDIPVETIQGYVDSFKHGAFPHGGGGVGLERVVMLFLGLDNIRKSSLFPRDPKRLAP